MCIPRLPHECDLWFILLPLSQQKPQLLLASEWCISFGQGFCQLKSRTTLFSKLSKSYALNVASSSSASRASGSLLSGIFTEWAYTSNRRIHRPGFLNVFWHTTGVFKHLLDYCSSFWISTRLLLSLQGLPDIT